MQPSLLGHDILYASKTFQIWAKLLVYLHFLETIRVRVMKLGSYLHLDEGTEHNHRN